MNSPNLQLKIRLRRIDMLTGDFASLSTFQILHGILSMLVKGSFHISKRKMRMNWWRKFIGSVKMYLESLAADEFAPFIC